MFDGQYPVLVAQKLEEVRCDADTARGMRITGRHSRMRPITQLEVLRRLFVALKPSPSHPGSPSHSTLCNLSAAVTTSRTTPETITAART